VNVNEGVQNGSRVKLAFHDADIDTDFLAWILADTPDTRD